MSLKNWVLNQKPNPGAALRLFAFPFAGGSSATYHAWASVLPPFVEVWPVEIPGRGRRVSEQPFTDLSSLVDQFCEAAAPCLDKPIVLFGHSMGAMIAFEVARRLRRMNDKQPAHLIVSGRRAPQIPDDEEPTYNLPDPDLLEEVKRLNGTPSEVLAHPELMQLILPILRADFQLVQTYSYTANEPLGCPITGFGGLKDEEETRERLLAWQQQTTSTFTLRMLPGDHFFINSCQPLLLRLISQELHHIVTTLGQS